MTVIAKIDPVGSVATNDTISVHARSYAGCTPTKDEEVFIWTSEKSGGRGLEAMGSILEISEGEFPNKTGSETHREIILSVVINAATPDRTLTLTELAPERDTNREQPVSKISRVLYKHAPNKIVSVDSKVASFIRSHF